MWNVKLPVSSSAESLRATSQLLSQVHPTGHQQVLIQPCEPAVVPSLGASCLTGAAMPPAGDCRFGGQSDGNAHLLVS